MTERFIPVEVQRGNNWHMDISKLSLSDLIELKKELCGTISYRALDSVIYELCGITHSSYNNLSKRENQRNKELSHKTKKFSKNKCRR